MAYIESRFPNVLYWINSTQSIFKLQVRQFIFKIPPPELCLSLSFYLQVFERRSTFTPSYRLFFTGKEKTDSWQSKKFPNHRVSATCIITEAKISIFYPATGELLFWSTWNADKNENPPWPTGCVLSFSWFHFVTFPVYSICALPFFLFFFDSLILYHDT